MNKSKIKLHDVCVIELSLGVIFYLPVVFYVIHNHNVVKVRGLNMNFSNSKPSGPLKS